MAGGCERGGILGLLDLIEEHRAAIEYDFRSRLHLPLSAVPDDVGWDEAIRLIGVLRKDPESLTASSLEGWDYSISREALLLADLFDLQQAAAGVKRPKPHPMRPWKQKGDVERRGNAGGRSPEQVKALLARAKAGAA